MNRRQFIAGALAAPAVGKLGVAQPAPAVAAVVFDEEFVAMCMRDAEESVARGFAAMAALCAEY